MTNEIKEIIKLRCEEEIEVTYFAKDDSLTGTYIDCGQLLDYITNLQEENRKLKELKYKFFDCSGDEESFTLEDYLELGNKLYDLQEENELIKKEIDELINIEYKCEFLDRQNDDLQEEKQRLLESADCLSKGYSDLEQRIDKAVEYIEHSQSYGTMAQVMPHLKPYVNGNDLLDILRGDD